MNPYVNPADRYRAEANGYETFANRAADTGDGCREAGNLDGAAAAYMRAAGNCRKAAEHRRYAAALPGGNARDLDAAGWLMFDALNYETLAADLVAQAVVDARLAEPAP